MGRKPKVGIHIHAWPRLVVHVAPMVMTRLKDRAIREGTTVTKLVRQILAREAS